MVPLQQPPNGPPTAAACGQGLRPIPGLAGGVPEGWLWAASRYEYPGAPGMSLSLDHSSILEEAEQLRKDEEYLPQTDERNKMLKEKLVSRLRFEQERTEVLLMVKGRYMVCEAAGGSEKDSSELSSSVEKKYPILRTAVYRASTERKHKATIKEEEPIDDDVVMHILRLRGKLGWQTKLPSCEQLAREADVSRLQKFTVMRPLLLKDTGEYIYCLQRNRNNFKAPYNPYDLQAVSTNAAMKNKEYWTVTASFVSKNGGTNALALPTSLDSLKDPGHHHLLAYQFTVEQQSTTPARTKSVTKAGVLLCQLRD
ncbi:PREDICTED: dynein heavy chain 14, axonemal [Charadrius vociferus]|uniref:dynein heavy chain 14, axonemal n=1 Tax=Charadrius vociferus TaxID=50402 RepID=UPI000521A87F|nr:PREDICTED: dynein heavy chain 14, axonemal [Charadrius vociferus]